MALQWALAGNIVIACAYAAITLAIVVPVRRAGQLRTNRLAMATALIFFSCAVGHGFHALMYARAGMIHDSTGWRFWASALWDVFTALVGVFYWTLRRSYGVLLGGTGALFVDPAEQQRHHDIDVRERVAAGRAEAEAERDAQSAMLRAVISNSQSAIYVKGLDGRYLLANETFQTAFGVTEEELVGKTDDYLDPDLAPQWQANDRRAHAGPIRIEETAAGRRTYESTKFPLYDSAGELYAICGVSLDVTDLREAARAAEAARDEALTQSQIKSDFLATMSHEIRTPMNGVLGLASLLLNTGLDETQLRYATGIHNAGTALLTVINDILDFSKIESGKVVLDPDDFDLGAVLTGTAALLTPTAGEKDLELVVRRGPKLPVTVHGDGGRLRQILLNLAGNAVKFTGEGSVTVRADLLGTDPILIRFEVTDTGIGIDPGTAERLFEPFTQADASTTRVYGGTGLGLAISRQLTEAMGGRIGVDSTPGQGSTFWCEIPFAPATGTVTGRTADPAGLRILVAGSTGDSGTLEDDLRSWKMTVTTARTAAAAIDMLREGATNGRPFDLLLLDADAPDVDTDGLARLVTADPTIPAVHIIVLNDDTPDAPGTRTHLPKPVHRSQLYNLLAQSMATTAAPGPAVTTPAAPPASKGTVLLVEDNDINQMVAVGILTRLGYAADVAADGQIALDLAARRSYDAILMDCRMPRMDGFTATAHLRTREAAGIQHTPIIAMTASALVADRERCLNAGMDDYLSKPVNPSELAATLARWITGEPRPATPPARQASTASPDLSALPARPAAVAAGRDAEPRATRSGASGQPGGRTDGAGRGVAAAGRSPEAPGAAGDVPARGALPAAVTPPAHLAGGRESGPSPDSAGPGPGHPALAGMATGDARLPDSPAGDPGAADLAEGQPGAARFSGGDPGAAELAEGSVGVAGPVAGQLAGMGMPDGPGAGATSAARARPVSGWLQDPPGTFVPARLGPGRSGTRLDPGARHDPGARPDSTPYGAVSGDGTDPIGDRLSELAGDHSEPERALVQRLINSFLARAPHHLTAITEAVTVGDLQTVEDQAHSLTGAAGNIGAAGLRRVCAQIEDAARAGRLPQPGVLHSLHTELDQAEHRLREAAAV